MSEHPAIIGVEGNKNPTLAVGIPAGRNLEWTGRILDKLERPDADVEVLVARWAESPLTNQELEGLNALFPTKQVLSEARHGAAMRNAIIREATSTHILFLDDDMVPGQNLLASALVLAAHDPGAVHQGIPYRTANAHNWLARTEGRLYERGYRKYINEDDTVSLLDARLLLAPVETLKETPFDESLVFGSGDGSELARSLSEKGVVLRLARKLDAAHTNRDTVASLAEQKLTHGRGRAYELQKHGPGENGWLDYGATYAKRHYLEPAVRMINGEIGKEELLYIWGTNTILWAGVFEYMLRSYDLRLDPKR